MENRKRMVFSPGRKFLVGQGVVGERNTLLHLRYSLRHGKASNKSAKSRAVVNDAWFKVPMGQADVWRVLDAIGTSAQAFAQAPASTGHGKHCPAKIGLGLPRRIDQYTDPDCGSFGPGHFGSERKEEEIGIFFC